MPSQRTLLYSYAIAFLILIAIMLVPYALRDPYKIDVATRILQSILLVMSLHLVLAVGRLNLAHISFMGIGAYLAAALTMNGGLSPWIASVIAIVTASAISAILAVIVLRLAGAYFFLITFAFLNIVVLFFQSFFTPFFGGASGLIGVPGLPSIGIGSVALSFTTNAELYYLSAVLLLMLGAGILRLYYSRFSDMSSAIRQSERLSESLGIDTLRHKTTTFVVSSFVAAIVGVLFAYSQKVVHYNDFNIDAMLRLVVFVVVGGIGTVWGAIAGTIVISILAEFLRGFHAYETLIYGAMIVGILLFLPEGLGGLALRWRAAGKNRN